MAADNLLTVLHKWAHRQDENFVTDAFAHLLRNLLRETPTVGSELIAMLCGGRLPLAPAQCSGVLVVTQGPSDIGTPDITITWDDSLLFVEAKLDSGFGRTQLQRYHDLLARRIGSGSCRQGCLTTLTRRQPSAAASELFKCVTVRWHAIAKFLNAVPDSSISNPQTLFLVRQFSEFLTQRMVEMQQITSELSEGVHALRRMLEMIGESLDEFRVPVHQKMSGWYKVGYWLENKRWRVVISYRHPHVIVFETVGVPITQIHMAEILDGMFHEPKKGDKRRKWINRLDLNSNEGEFFQLPAEQQKDRIDAFLNTSVKIARQIDALNV